MEVHLFDEWTISEVGNSPRASPFLRRTTAPHTEQFKFFNCNTQEFVAIQQEDAPEGIYLVRGRVMCGGVAFDFATPR